MKKLCAAAILGLWLLSSFGCSSAPPGTIPISDLQKPERIGQNVVVVGMAETKTPMSTLKMFKLYDGGRSVWVSLEQSMEMPPQGVSVRVFGALQQKEFNVIGKVYYIEANRVAME